MLTRSAGRGTALGLLAALCLGTHLAQAAILIRNDNQKPVQFTVYDLTRTELGSGCVPAKQSRRWANPHYETTGGLFFLRAEVKDGANCAGTTLYDTQFGPAMTINANTTRERTLPPGATPAFTDGERTAAAAPTTRPRRPGSGRR